MKCAEQVRNVYVRVQMWKAVYCYIISTFMYSNLGCGFPVSSADFRLCLHKFCGEAERGRLAGQRREFKTYRKSTAQIIMLPQTNFLTQVDSKS